jgi:pimeloyl-ACP methyl ester carboxylesterase
MIEDVNFISDDLILFARLFKASDSKKCVLLLHGGGRESDCYRFEYLQNKLLENGISSFSIDFRGCGKSEGNFEDGSLNNRIKDAVAAIDFVTKKLNIKSGGIIVAGASMSGHVACRLLDTFKFSGVILQCAAAYSQDSESAKLNEEFSKLIRVNNNWVNSPAFKSLSNFKGRKIALYGEFDDVIPEGVKRSYKDIVGVENYIVLSGGGHKLLAPENEFQQRALELLTDKIVNFVSTL